MRWSHGFSASMLMRRWARPPRGSVYTSSGRSSTAAPTPTARATSAPAPPLRPARRRRARSPAPRPPGTPAATATGRVTPPAPAAPRRRGVVGELAAARAERARGWRSRRRRSVGGPLDVHHSRWSEERVRPTAGGLALPDWREWRNGRRAGFRSRCPKGRGGSTPPSRTPSDPEIFELRSSRERFENPVLLTLAHTSRGSGFRAPIPADCSQAAVISTVRLRRPRPPRWQPPHLQRRVQPRRPFAHATSGAGCSSPRGRHRTTNRSTSCPDDPSSTRS